MPDRYGERDDDDDPAVIVDQSVVDFESRRLDRESIAAKQREQEQRKRLSETRATHAPLGREQATMAKSHQRAVTTRADARRKAMQIASCGLCDDQGYRGCGAVCDHVDRTRTHRRGMDAVRQAMGWDDPPEVATLPTPQAPAAPQPPTRPPDPNPPPDGDTGLTAPPGRARCQRCGRPGEVQSQIDVDSGWCWDCLCALTPPPAMIETVGPVEPTPEDY